VAYAELDLYTRRLTYACAGHLPPLLLAPEAAPRALWEGRSPPLGATPEEPAPQATIALQDGATVLLVTDGLIERRGRSLDDSLQELLDRLGSYGAAPPADFLDDLVSSLFDGVEQIDDVCMLAVSLQRTRSHPESPPPRERGLETDPGVAPPPHEALAS
jgi:serine phosphatase RsbU (regulator of sigma subunit)